MKLIHRAYRRAWQQIRAVAGFSDPSPEVFDYLGTTFLRAHYSRFREFFRTADALVMLPHRTLLRRLPEAAAHCLREALDEIPKAAAEKDTSRWRELSLDVVYKARAYRNATGLEDVQREEALDDLLVAVGKLETFHEHEPLKAERGITNLVFQVTGGNLATQAAREFHDVAKQLKTFAHSSGSLEDVLECRQAALEILDRMFRPPDQVRAELDELAAIEHPEASDLAELGRRATNEHLLRHFMVRVVSARWLVGLGTDELLRPPIHTGSWPVLAAIQRFSETEPQLVAQWLRSAAKVWRDESAASHLATAAQLIGEHGHNRLLSLLSRYPQNPWIRLEVERAVTVADPTSKFVERAARLLLNDHA